MTKPWVSLLFLCRTTILQGFGWPNLHHHLSKRSFSHQPLLPGILPTSSCSHSCSNSRLLTRWASSSSSSNNKNNKNNNNNNNNNNQYEPVRLNKVFKATHSRRQADQLIQQGRVRVNGTVSHGCMVRPYQDQVTLDGTPIQGWERLQPSLLQQAHTKTGSSSSNQNNKHYQSSLEYFKYFKPRGVTCTTDTRVRGNILQALRGFRPDHRVFPVGRLDKASSGLILLTSDGRVTNSTLRGPQKQPKVYQVRVDRRISERDLQLLREGVVITSVTKHDGNQKSLTAKTNPCQVTPMGPKKVTIVLEEGRNRQIRKMMESLGYQVQDLHRVQFGEITLDRDMGPGDWKPLNAKEMKWLLRVVGS
eukprot:Nitzschia sp. Nitz4//scaffold35_size145790//21362//22447//NITZ4_003010-RA/size145790-processed-gene-0.225-mRNA-1//-1//CDS//3329549064//3055//frame0